MAWTAVNTISLKTGWQYSAPVEGEYFRLKHSHAPNSSYYQVAQAHFNEDNSIDFAGGQILEVGKEQEYDTLRLEKPGHFTDRRIAIRRIPQASSIETVMRSFLHSNLFRSDAAQTDSGYPSKWSVDVEVSDYVDPLPQVTTGGNSTSNSNDMWKILQEIDLAGVNTYAISNLNGNVDKAYQIILEGKLAFGGNPYIKLHVNADTGNNYRSTITYNAGEGASTYTAVGDGLIIASTARDMTCAITSQSVLSAISTNRKLVSGTYGCATDNSNFTQTCNFASFWNNTADNITSLSFDCGSSTFTGKLILGCINN